ncbi:MAG: thiamine phosphate synthase [Bacilli bacterium]
MISDQQRHRLPLEQALLQSVLGGADVVQVRQKKAPAAETFAFVRGLMAQCQEATLAPCIFVNDRLDVAMASHASGVHLAAKSIPVDAARQVRQQARWPGLIGCSVHSLAEAKSAERLGADYVTFGHVFPSLSHSALAPQGIGTLAEIVSQTDIPVIAIGGIDEHNISQVLETGCSGVAVIGAVLQSDDPRRVTSRLLDRIARSAVSPRRRFPHAGEEGSRHADLL